MDARQQLCNLQHQRLGRTMPSAGSAPNTPRAPQPKYPAKYASSARAASASRYQNQQQYTPTLPAFAWTGLRDLAMVWAFRTAVIHKHLQKNSMPPH